MTFAQLAGGEMEIKDRARIYKDKIEVDLFYPTIDIIQAIEIDLIDVRAADPIRIEYDFDRNGWVIKQTIGQENGQDVWEKVAFITAQSVNYNGCPECGEILKEKFCSNCDYKGE